MFHVVLFEPEIPPNTGNIMRMCANTGARLHLIEPLGYSLDDKLLARAGMDYRDLATYTVHPDWAHCRAELAGQRMFAISTRGTRMMADFAYQAGDVFIFGPESRGLPEAMLEELGREQCMRIPMQAGCRSLNLSNAAAVVVYEAWRQCGYVGGA